MLNLILGAVLLMAAGVAFVLFAAFRAPVGYEDESGFHYGPETPEPVQDFHGALPMPAR